MAEAQKNAAGNGEVKSNPVKVTSGVQEVKYNGEGKTIAQVRDTLKKVLNLGPDTQCIVGEGKDKRVLTPEEENTTILNGGESIEFKKASGQKGI